MTPFQNLWQAIAWSNRRLKEIDEKILSLTKEKAEVEARLAMLNQQRAQSNYDQDLSEGKA